MAPRVRRGFRDLVRDLPLWHRHGGNSSRELCPEKPPQSVCVASPVGGACPSLLGPAGPLRLLFPSLWDGWKHAAVDRSGVVVFTVGPVATGSRRRRLVLRLSQKDALQALFQQNPYPGIATRERLARELGIAESRVQVWFQNRRARHPQQSPSGPGGAAATTPPAPEDRRTPPAVQSTSPPLRPSPPQESMPPSAAPAAPFGAPAFWVPGTAPGVCVGQPLMIFMVQPSPVALRPSGKPPPPAQYGVTDLALPPASSRHAQMCRRSLLANPSPKEGLDPVVSESIRTPCLFPCEPPCDGKHGLCSCQPREARLPPTGIVMEGNLGAAPLRRLHGMPPPPPDGWKHAAVDRSGVVVFTVGPVATGSRRRRLVLRLSQKDALQALFQQNPYPGIATRERLARELGIAESRVQVWFQNRRARHPQQSPSGPGGAAATTPPAPEDRRTPPAVQSTSPPLRPSPPQESMPPSAAPAAPFGAPAFWVPGTAPGVCVGQPLMIFMVQPSPVALRPSGKPPPPAQYGVTDLALPPASSRHAQMCRRSLLANPSPKEGLDPVVSESIRTPCLFPCEPPCDGKHGLCSCQPREARLPPTGIVMEGNLGAAPLRRLHGMPPPPPDGWKHAAVDRSGVVVFTVGPVATGSRRRRLVLRLSQKDALQALFQQNPYPGIATRERLARELGIAESRVQVWFQNRRARHPQQSPSGPGGAAATTPPAPEDRRTPPAVQSTSPPLRPSPPQESMPPSAAPAAPFGAPAFWVPGTAPGVCVGQPLMIFMVQPSPVALRPSGKPPPPAQYGVTDLALPPASSRHAQMCRRSLLANPSPKEGLDPVVSESIRTPCLFPCEPPCDGKHGLCSCQPREARLPPTGIVMEGNLGAAPLRRLHGMPPPPPDGWKHAAVDRSGVVVFTVGPVATGSRRRRLVLRLSQKDALQALFQQNPYPGIATRERLARELGIAESRVQVWFQNRRARHPQQSPSGPGGAAATTPPAPEDRRTPPAVQSTSPPLRPSPPQESMPPSAAPAAPFGAPAFWVPGTAPGVCVGQPLMIFMVQPSPVALRPSGKPPPPAQYGVTDLALPPASSRHAQMCRRSLLANPSPKEGLDPVVSESIRTPCLFPCEPPCDGKHGLCSCQPREARLPPTGIVMEGNLGAAPLRRLHGMPPPPPDGWKHAAVDRSGVVVFTVGPVATGSRRRRLVLRLSQKDALQALFQQNPYPGIATRERLARELGIAESRVQVWFQNRRARHPQQSPSGPGGAAATTPPAPEDRRTPPAVQSTSPPLRPSPPQESMPPSAAPAAPFGAPAFWVPGTAPGVCVGQPLMIFMVQPSPVALRPSGKPPPPAQYGVTDLALPPASSRHAQMCRRSLLANPSPKEGLDPVVSESIRTPCLFPCEPPCDGKHGLCSCQPREARLPPTGIVMEGNLGAAPLRRLHGMPPPPPDGWKHAAVDRSGVVVFTVGPVATGSRRRRLVLRLSQKDALQALFQQNPYPGIATRERLARELGIAESRVQVWFQNRRARHPQQSPSGPGGAAATTPPAPEDRRTPPAVQSTSPPLRPSPPQESMPPSAAPAAPFGAPAFWVPGTAPGVCVGQPLMIFMVQPSPVALRPSGKPPPPAQYGVTDLALPPASSRHAQMCRRSLLANPSPKEGLDPVVSESIRTPCLFPCEPPCDGKHGLCSCQPREARLPPTGIVMEGNLGAAPLRRLHGMPPPPPDGWKHAAVDRSGVVVFTVGPVATGSRRRRLVLRLSQKDALQALFQQNPYPGIATRERLARELGIAESRVQVWFQNRRARHPQQSPSGPGGAAATTPPAPEDRRTPPAVQSTSPPLRPSPPQESMPPSAAPAAPFGAPAFWVPGTAPGVCVGQPLMIFMVQPSPVALRPSGKPPPPAQYGVTDLALPPASSRHAQMCRRSLLANPSPKEGLDPVVSESIRTPCLFPCEPPCDGKHGLCSCQPREARLPPTGIVMEGNLGAAPLRRLHGMPPPPPDGWKHAAVDRSGVVVFTVGPVATGSRRRRLVLRLSQKDALQALFQQNPYPGIATRERLARELGIAESRVQVWFQNRRARHPQQSPSGPGGAAATTPPAPEDRRTPPAVQSTSPPLRPSPPQESMPPSAAPAAPFGAPAFWVPGTAPGVCVGQPLMIFMVQPSPVALRPSGKPPPPAQYGVTDLALPPASSRHAQMCRRSLLANPSPKEGLDPVVSESIRTPCLFPCEPPWWV
ncbi:hypothetical protein MG293_013378 [Ovis ammon polii]|uniref:Homeobox domain-containing protein n=1 Tax=Ovis ammon polii TaxID=230172 RepID=A0AAD4Y4B7_OVIAM|nr:hypothetical protein MG293_013378 [Ovis ammon polii]